VTLLLLAVVTYAYIGLKATQNLNIIHHRVWWVPPTSLLLAATEVYVIARVARSGLEWGVVLALATGGSLGSITAMHVHQRARRRKQK
jgi:hypothetical protein